MSKSVQQFLVIIVAIVLGTWALQFIPEPKKTEKKMSQYIDLGQGLKSIILKKGNGPRAQAGKVVSVHYTGWLFDGYDLNGYPRKGKQFDSSRGRGVFKFLLGKGQVIKGWDIGVAAMRVGERRLFIIPSELAYGSRGAGSDIPPNATLIFDVELLAIN